MDPPTGDWFRAKIEDEFVVERGTWGSERVERVTAALQREVPAAARLETLVVWLDDWTAFTLPGRTVYLSRRLLETLPTDAAAALVVAHELAHHRLGHVPDLSTAWRKVGGFARAVLHRLVHRPEHERDADLLAVEMCLAAGYDLDACLVAFERMEHEALDWGDVDGVVDDAESQARRRSHPVVRRRIADMRVHAAAMARGHRLAHELAVRARDRRRRGMAIAAGVAATLAIAIIARRPPPGLL